MKIYLDNCCYNRPYDDQSYLRISLESQAKQFVQYLIREKKLDLVTSYYSNSFAGGYKMTDVTYAPTATVELMTKGMDCLVKNMGIVEAEYFIAAIQRERFDYTKWHQEYFFYIIFRFSTK